MGSAAPSSVRTTNPKPNIVTSMRCETHLRYLLLLLMPALIWASPQFPQTIQYHGEGYQKLGEHRYYHKRIFKVYDAVLYTAPQASADNVLNADRSFKLTFSYLRDIDKALAIDAADRALEKNLDPNQAAIIASRLRDLNSAYVSVAKGDTTTLHYQPGLGTTYSINGEPQTTIPGADFAQLYFRIWLGEQPLSTAL
ncbi:MAG: chalcone isomerase family protein, partial [Coraliomargarita sp.]